MNKLLYLFLLCAGSLLLSSCSEELVLANNAKSDYRIVLPITATKSEVKAASFLQRYLLKVGGAKLPIIRDRDSQLGPEISIGLTNRLASVNTKYTVPEGDGFSVFSNNESIYFLGGSQKGVIYGVSSFLENYLGIRLLTSEVEVFQKRKRIAIPEDLNWNVLPPFKFRSTHYRHTWDPFFADWHKLNHLPNGGHPDWGYWCHSFDQLVPPEEYYDSHPEYFAEVNGSRIAAQLCLTNPDVLEISIENLRKAMEAKPELSHWSVSQNDNVSFCQCEECKKMDAEHGGPMGSLLTYINQIADRFPDKIISTLAYQYSRKPPLDLVPRKNVNIMLCTIELDRSKPIATAPSASSFRDDLEGWGKLTEDILIWDYVIQFENLVSPFPNLHVLQPNLQYFLENNAFKHFQQGNREVGGEFAELRSYLITKLLWDPNTDLEQHMDDFLSGYYGKASTQIKLYIDELHDGLLESGQGLGIFGHPSQAAETYLSIKHLDRYDDIFDRAERAVRKDSTILERVKIARMPLQYARLELATRVGTGPGGMFIMNEAEQWVVDPQFPALANELVTLANKQGVTRFKEWHTSPSEYLSSLEKSWATDMQKHQALFLSPKMEHAPSKKYAGGNAAILTDGLHGPQLSYAYNWLGFEGEEMQSIIDFEKEITARELRTSWLQDIRSWVFLPLKVKYSISIDGKTWQEVGRASREDLPSNEAMHSADYKVDLDETATFRYLKVSTESYIKCPPHHPGAGQPAWIFVDEIVVN